MTKKIYVVSRRGINEYYDLLNYYNSKYKSYNVNEDSVVCKLEIISATIVI